MKTDEFSRIKQQWVRRDAVNQEFCQVDYAIT
jgi:hypothetical protein